MARRYFTFQNEPDFHFQLENLTFNLNSCINN